MTVDPTKLFKSRVVFLAGEEEALRRRAFTSLLDLATQDGDFDLQTFEADEAGPVDWIAAVGIAPFLSERRTVVVRHVLRRDPLETRSGSESKDALARALSSLPDSALLILVADEEPGDEPRQRRLATLRKAWEKSVHDAGGAVAVFSCEPKKVRDTIREEASRLGKTMSEASADSLAEMTGGSLSRAIEELEKLALYVGSEDQIRASDIRSIVIPSREWNVFKLIEAIVDGAVPEALRQLRILVGSQTKAEEAAFSRILPMLSRQLRLLWQARLCVEARCSPSSPPPQVASLFLEKPNFGKEASYRQAKLMQQARQVDFDALQQCLQAVSDADAKLKGLADSFSPVEALEYMILEMVQIVGPKPALRRSGRS